MNSVYYFRIFSLLFFSVVFYFLIYLNFSNFAFLFAYFSVSLSSIISFLPLLRYFLSVFFRSLQSPLLSVSCLLPTHTQHVWLCSLIRDSSPWFFEYIKKTTSIAIRTRVLTRQTQSLMGAPYLFSTYRYQQCKFLDLPQPGLYCALQCGGKVTTLLHKNGVPLFMLQKDKLLLSFHSLEFSPSLPDRQVRRYLILLQL
jgi:hypothetical protein